MPYTTKQLAESEYLRLREMPFSGCILESEYVDGGVVVNWAEMPAFKFPETIESTRLLFKKGCVFATIGDRFGQLPIALYEEIQ